MSTTDVSPRELLRRAIALALCGALLIGIGAGLNALVVASAADGNIVPRHGPAVLRRDDPERFDSMVRRDSLIGPVFFGGIGLFCVIGALWNGSASVLTARRALRSTKDVERRGSV